MCIYLTFQFAEDSLKEFLNTKPDSKQANARSYLGNTPGTTSGIDPNYMNQVLAHKPVELFHLIPILLLLAFIPLVLPLIFQLFAGFMTPMNFTHGKRKRDTSLHNNPVMNQVLLDLIKTYGSAIDKYHSLSK